MQVMPPKITSNNYVEYLLEYAYKVNEFFTVDAIAECPYIYSIENYDYDEMQAMVWFTHARVNPETGLTILEEFVKKYVKDR